MFARWIVRWIGVLRLRSWLPHADLDSRRCLISGCCLISGRCLRGRYRRFRSRHLILPPQLTFQRFRHVGMRPNIAANFAHQRPVIRVVPVSIGVAVIADEADVRRLCWRDVTSHGHIQSSPSLIVLIELFLADGLPAPRRHRPKHFQHFARECGRR